MGEFKLVAVCSARPRPSVQRGEKGAQWWARDVYHLQTAPGLTFCGRDSSDWLTIGEIPELTADCCKKCSHGASAQILGLVERPLTPFEQGYVEALLRVDWIIKDFDGIGRRLRFSDLAPATLAAIRKDCAEAQQDFTNYGDGREAGAAFWRNRQGGDVPEMPPLLVSLGDDGLVYLREGL